eukprot:1725841-Prymnesium_polylepis.1
MIYGPRSRVERASTKSRSAGPTLVAAGGLGSTTSGGALPSSAQSRSTPSGCIGSGAVRRCSTSSP